MPTVNYRLPDGSIQTVNAELGENLMSLATDNGIESILGRCGGHCNCGTCHVYVDAAWLDKLTPPQDDEDMMLDGTPAERLPNSRLGCQITMTPELDGLIVTVASEQE